VASTLVAYLAFTVLFGATTSLATHRSWAIVAAPAYSVALLMALLPRMRRWAPSIAVAGSFVAPLIILCLMGRAQPEVGVVIDGAVKALRDGSPYISNPQTLSEYRPYAPLLFLFGIPAAIFNVPLIWDPRVGMDILLVSLIATVDRLRRPSAPPLDRPGLLMLLSLPLVALSLSVSAIDAPMTGLCIASFALYDRERYVLAAILATLAMGMKPTAVLVVLAMLLSLLRRKGRGHAAGCFAVSAIITVMLTIAPFLVLSPGAFWRNVVAFPAGLAETVSPAQSPFPGVLIAHSMDFGINIAIGLTAAAAIASLFAIWKWPYGVRLSLARRVALAFSVIFLLAPNSRAGYFMLPVLLWATSSEEAQRNG